MDDAKSWENHLTLFILFDTASLALLVLKMYFSATTGARYFPVPARRFPWVGGYISNYDEAKACRCAGAMRVGTSRTLVQAIAVLRRLR